MQFDIKDQEYLDVVEIEKDKKEKQIIELEELDLIASMTEEIAQLKSKLNNDRFCELNRIISAVENMQLENENINSENKSTIEIAMAHIRCSYFG